MGDVLPSSSVVNTIHRKVSPCCNGWCLVCLPFPSRDLSLVLECLHDAANTFVLHCKGYCRLSLSSERGCFGGRPRCHWSRLETRAKEHSVEPSQRVTCNPVATVKAIGRYALALRLWT